MERVYIETSVVSYLVARPSRDVFVVGYQQSTIEWWEKRRPIFDCVISQLVIDEAGAGNALEAQKRLTALSGMKMIPNDVASRDLTKLIMESGVLPSKAISDAAHIAVASTNQVDYLLTWNCRHLANAQIKRQIARICDTAGFRMPIICTPLELMGVDHV